MDPMELAFRADRDQAARDGRDNDWIFATGRFADWLEDHDRAAEAQTLHEELANAIKDATAIPRPSNWPRIDKLPGLSVHQADELGKALRRPVGILTGSPGTGKTWTTAALVSILQPAETAICAPTGKAAVRIGEALVLAGVRGLGARTIHQLLGIGRNGHDGAGWGFIHNRRNPLPYRFLVVEEASMLSADLAADLLEACRPGTHVLFVGDPDQLPPVGHGAPLRDWMASGLVPVGRLTEVHRNAGAIAAACRLIRNGEPDEALKQMVYLNRETLRLLGITTDTLAAPPGINWQHVETASLDESLATLRSILPAWQHGPGGLSRDVQILTATNKAGDAINALCQNLLNGAGAAHQQRIWGIDVRPGDRIVSRSNQWVGATTGSTEYLANGECGVVLSTYAGGGGVTARFDSPDRELYLGRTTARDDEPFSLGYCLTCHKFQGSEVRVCVVVFDNSPGVDRVMGREWIYTALSRARTLCITIGPMATLRQAIGRHKLDARKTFLVPRLQRSVQHGHE